MDVSTRFARDGVREIAGREVQQTRTEACREGHGPCAAIVNATQHSDRRDAREPASQRALRPLVPPRVVA